MAKVRLGKYEVKKALLPFRCMQCGAEATVFKRKGFSWNPPWVIILILFGLLPYVIVALLTTKRMTIEAPLCDQHRNHWSWRNWFIGGGFVVLVGLGIAAMGFLISQENQRGGAANPLGGWFCAGTGIVGLIWLVAAAIIQTKAIRPTEITDRSITLTHVSREFAEALEEARASYQGEESDDS